MTEKSVLVNVHPFHKNLIPRERRIKYFQENLPEYTDTKRGNYGGEYPSCDNEEPECLLLSVNPYTDERELWAIVENDGQLTKEKRQINNPSQKAPADPLHSKLWHTGKYMCDKAASILNLPKQELEQWYRDQEYEVMDGNRRVKGIVIGFQETDNGYPAAIIATPSNLRILYGIDFKDGELRYLGLPRSRK